MATYSMEQRVFVVKHYFNCGSIADVQKKYKKHFETKKFPCRNGITNLVKKFENTGSILDNLKGVVGCKRTVRTDETIRKIRKINEKYPKKPITTISKELGVGFGTVQKIFADDLKKKTSTRKRSPKDIELSIRETLRESNMELTELADCEFFNEDGDGNGSSMEFDDDFVCVIVVEKN